MSNNVDNAARGDPAAVSVLSDRLVSKRKRGLMAAYQSAYKMWDRSRRHSEDRQVSIKE